MKLNAKVVVGSNPGNIFVASGFAAKILFQYCSNTLSKYKDKTLELHTMVLER